jgi:tRNA-dihydrouridine synthase B
MKLDWSAQNKPIIALSPMADMTDSAYCQIVKKVTGEKEFPIMFREMVSSEAVIRGNDKTLEMTAIHPDERPLVQQLFGSDPAIMRDAAEIIQRDFSPEGFDINMGCPVYKITSNFNGCALMKDPKIASEMVKQMKSVLTVPLSVKIRLGWSNDKDCLTFAPAMQDAGAELITVHGRTKEQGYSGISNWEQIAQVKKSVQIPLLANGDIHTPEAVVKALEVTRADGVLIARGALGNPWFFKQTKQLLETGRYDKPTLEERLDVIKLHLKYHTDQYGERGVITFRKHISWYFKGMDNFKEHRMKLVEAKTSEEVIQELSNILITVKSD